MNFFLWNLLMAVAWAMLTGEFTLTNLVGGFLLGFLMLNIARRPLRSRQYLNKVRVVISFALFFFVELTKANLRVAYEVITPDFHMRPGVIAIPLDLESEAEITLLANIITLTPGTLSLDVSTDRKMLYIHAMYIDGDIEVFRQKIKDGYERRVREVMA